MPGQEPSRWRMCAHHRDGTLWNVGPRRYVEAHGLLDPIVEVEITVVPDDDPAATHWAWLAAGTHVPTMIWPNLPCYQACFPYGPKAEEDAGRGRTVRLAVVELAAAGR